MACDKGNESTFRGDTFVVIDPLFKRSTPIGRKKMFPVKSIVLVKNRPFMKGHIERHCVIQKII